MANRIDHEKAKRKKRHRPKKKRETIDVHPNSIAARKWGRTKWSRDKR